MLTLANLSLRLEEKQILENISFTLRPESLTVLVGRNGSGKSALLSCINRQKTYTGRICCGDQDLKDLSARERARLLAILPQTLPAPHIPVSEMVSFGRNPYLDLSGRLSEQDRKAVKDALADARAEDLADRYADTLSGGELQRCALAMILAQNTPIALLDEPTAHMDAVFEDGFLRQLTALKTSRKKTFLVVLHDLSLAVRYADDMMVLDAGKLVFHGTTRECLSLQVLENTFSLRRYTLRENDGEKIFFSPN